MDEPLFSGQALYTISPYSDVPELDFFHTCVIPRLFYFISVL